MLYDDGSESLINGMATIDDVRHHVLCGGLFGIEDPNYQAVNNLDIEKGNGEMEL